MRPVPHPGLRVPLVVPRVDLLREGTTAQALPCVYQLSKSDSGEDA
jgi:hypothetical protein